MPTKSSDRLKSKVEKILKIWEQRAHSEIEAAQHQGKLALRNSLPAYLSLLVEALSNTQDFAHARKKYKKEELSRVGKEHGNDRAYSFNYTIDQLISEYHILRQVILDELDEEAPISRLEREIILSSIEQAVNDAATEFNNVMKDLQEQLSHTLAHDLRTPLSVAKVCADMILKRPDDPHQCEENAKRISNNMDRIDKMICDLLDVSRIRAGEKLHLEFKECNLNSLIKSMAEEFNITSHGRFIAHFKGSCIGYWNESGLRRMIENLSTNAVKYGNKDTPITMSLVQKEDSVTFSIHNEGAPIPLDEQSQIFHHFRRTLATESKTGWGLGLTIVKGMVEAHGGTLKLESEEGKGTTFMINLPTDSRSIQPK